MANIIPGPGASNQPDQIPPQILQALMAQAQQAQADPISLIKNLIVEYAQKDLNVDVQSKAILALAQAVKLLHEANQPLQQGVDPQVLAQIELQKAQADIQLKQIELQHKMKLREAELAARIQSMQQKTQTEAQVKQAEVQMKQEAHTVDQALKVAQAEQKARQNSQNPPRE